VTYRIEDYTAERARHPRPDSPGAVQLAITIALLQHAETTGLTRKRIATLMGLNTKTLSGKIRGRQMWKLDELYMICRLLDKQPEQILPPIQRRS
jgi:hypothetical protein